MKKYTAIIYKEYGTKVEVIAENINDAKRKIIENIKNNEYDNKEYELCDIDFEVSSEEENV